MMILLAMMLAQTAQTWGTPAPKLEVVCRATSENGSFKIKYYFSADPEKKSFTGKDDYSEALSGEAEVSDASLKLKWETKTFHKYDAVLNRDNGVFEVYMVMGASRMKSYQGRCEKTKGGAPF